MTEICSLGQKTKVLREYCGFTQTGISQYLGIDQSFLDMIEIGKSELTTEMVDKLEALYFVDLNSFQEADIEKLPWLSTLQADKINEEDLEAVSSINRIALNIRFMARLLEDVKSN